MGKNVTLHEEIRDILESQGNRWKARSLSTWVRRPASRNAQ